MIHIHYTLHIRDINYVYILFYNYNEGVDILDILLKF